MMNSKDLIIDKTKELMKLVCESDAYKEYHRNLDTIRRNKDLYDRLNLFRRQSLTVNSLEDPDQRSREIDRLYNEYETILIDPLTAPFLASEQKVCRMLRSVYETIADYVDLDLTHLYSDE